MALCLQRAEEDQTSEQRLSRETEKEDANTISDKDMVNRYSNEKVRSISKGPKRKHADGAGSSSKRGKSDEAAGEFLRPK
jgi:hypothetical protein